MKTFKRYVCRTCGSTNVSNDALARWNKTRQVWEIAGLLDNTDCDDCLAECSLKELRIPPAERPHRIVLVREAVRLLKIARDTLRLADAPKAAGAVSRALKSAEGAERNAHAQSITVARHG